MTLVIPQWSLRNLFTLPMPPRINQARDDFWRDITWQYWCFLPLSPSILPLLIFPPLGPITLPWRYIICPQGGETWMCQSAWLDQKESKPSSRHQHHLCNADWTTWQTWPPPPHCPIFTRCSPMRQFRWQNRIMLRLKWRPYPLFTLSGYIDSEPL